MSRGNHTLLEKKEDGKEGDNFFAGNVGVVSGMFSPQNDRHADMSAPTQIVSATSSHVSLSDAMSMSCRLANGNMLALCVSKKI